MKYIFLLPIFISVLLIPIVSVDAASGCCSGHGGVDCSRAQSNGRVICEDGWTGSSCSYDSMVKCQGYSPSSSSTQAPETTNYTYGCTNSIAKNYNSNATKDDGSCEYYSYGCTDVDALNYDGNAEKDNGNCIKKVYGCMESTASNYNELATISDDSCQYKYTKETKISTDETTNQTSAKTEEKTQSSFPVIFGIGIVVGGGFLIKKIVKK